MASRLPNYRQARGDRNRAKEQKKQRLRRREEGALRRKADRQPESRAATGSPEQMPDPTPLPGGDTLKSASW